MNFGSLQVETLDEAIDLINNNLSTQGLSKYLDPDIVHNSKSLTLDQYCALMTDVGASVVDFAATINTLIVDEKTQRVCARLEWTGTMIGKLVGVEPSGGPIQIWEHVYYQFQGGKITRVWAVVDWATFRRQMSQS